MAPSDSGSSISPSPQNTHLAARRARQTTAFQVFQEAGLINGHQRAQAHRHGGELPEIRHQPRVRVGGQTLAVHFLAEAVQILFAQAAFQEGAGVHARRRVALDIDQIAFLFVIGRAPEVVEAHVIQGGGGLEAGDVAAQLQVFFAGAQHQSGGVPANDGADAVFQLMVAVRALFLAHRDGVQVGGGGGERQIGAATAGLVDHFSSR